MKRISDIKKYERCSKLLWLANKEPQPFQPFALFNENIYELVKQKFHIESCFEGKTGDDNEAFFANEKEYTSFFKVRFTYQDLRIRIPFMQKEEKGYHVYFIYTSCYPKEYEAQSMVDHLWVLKHLGIHVTKVNAIHLNAEYVREDTLDVDALLIVNDSLYNVRNNVGKTIDELLEGKERDLAPILEKIDLVLQEETPEEKKRSKICTRRMKCPYFDTCFNIKPKDTSVLNLVSSGMKYELYDEGITDLKDVDLDRIEGTRHQFSQIMAAKTNGLVFDAFAIQEFMNNIIYPISYLDFEWQTYAFPPYKGMKPYDVLTFQYSLHVEYKGEEELQHKEYLGMDDCREEFIVRLIEDMPKEGTVLCYNVEGAEKLRLKQLAEQFPQYEDDLRQIWERMVDLSTPFNIGVVYDSRMAGMYSLKKLVKIFTDYDYADLDISEGMQAVFNYRHLKEEDVETKEKTKQELLRYCAMDTYAEYLIYHFLLDELHKRM